MKDQQPNAYLRAGPFIFDVVYDLSTELRPLNAECIDVELNQIYFPGRKETQIVGYEKKREFSEETLSAQADDTHLQRPHSSYPDLQLSFHAFYVFQFYSLPPTSSRRFSPEEQKLLSHTYSIGTHLVTTDIGSEASQSETAYDSFVWFSCSMAPVIIMIETSVTKLVLCLLIIY